MATPSPTDTPAPARRVEAVHDLNNLLSVIGGYALLLTEALPPGEEADWAGGIRAAVDQAAAALRSLRGAAGLPPAALAGCGHTADAG